MKVFVVPMRTLITLRSSSQSSLAAITVHHVEAAAHIHLANVGVNERSKL